LIEYGIYIPLFALLFYRDNRVRYIDPLNGSRKYGVIKTDIKKLVAAFSISELMFSFAKIYIHYELLQMSIVEAYQADDRFDTFLGSSCVSICRVARRIIILPCSLKVLILLFSSATVSGTHISHNIQLD
jgi:hypothetical protein